MKITITVEADDGSTQTSTYPNVTDAHMSSTPIYAGDDPRNRVRGFRVSLTLHALVDDSNFPTFCYITTGDPE